MKYTLIFAFSVSVTSASAAQDAPTDPSARLISAIDAKSTRYAVLAKQIWSFAEVGYQEVKSSALLATELETAGFKVTRGVVGIPTAFVAEYGSGKPVIGILGEFDALPGLSQEASPLQKAIIANAAGHGCGHNLFGTASVSAGIALADWLRKSGTKGTIRVYGTPAEEGGSGKVYMVRAGLFNDVDAVLHWHASDVNFAGIDRALANKSAKFRFHGLSAHASGAPEKGRSALDGVEAMDMMANMMREHIPSDARMHYVITSGGSAPTSVRPRSARPSRTTSSSGRSRRRRAARSSPSTSCPRWSATRPVSPPAPSSASSTARRRPSGTPPGCSCCSSACSPSSGSRASAPR